MQQPIDDDWDDLDDYDIEQCVLKENEILSQNPELLQKNFSQQSNVSKENKDHWLNGRFNSFTDELNASKTEVTNFVKENQKYDQRNNSSGSFSKPFVPAPKKQSFYKPLTVAPSTSFNTSDSFSNKEKESNPVWGAKSVSIQKQLEQVLQEKAKLEEENLVKQGEVYNLRCELKRRETSLETERVDQCIALEAAEKRGKEKATKIIGDLELKVKILERDKDRLEGNLLFKNREIDELLTKCKQSENQSSSSIQNGPRVVTRFSPSPKKRKLDDRFSPNKTLNFADKFDFGDKKKVVKSVEVQTESEAKEQTRIPIKITSGRGRINGCRKAFYLLNNSKNMDKQLTDIMESTSGSENAFLGRMVSSQDQQAVSSEHLLVKHACSSLENLLKATQNNNLTAGRILNKHDKNEVSTFLASSMPLVKILGVAKAGNETMAHNIVRILTLCMDYFLNENIKNYSGIELSLESLSFSIKQCTEIRSELCNTIVETMKRCCELSSIYVVPKLLFCLNSLNNFENFRQKLCVNITGHCLLKKFCTWLKNSKIHAKPKVICNDLAKVIAQLLHNEPSILVTNNQCNCSSLLLALFVNNLYCASKDKQWQNVLNGLKVLHSWQSKDKTWLEKASQLNSYSLLLSTIIRRAKFLRAKGILDQHTWELVYDIYEIDESSS